jgi:hypothetical protein
MCWYVDVTPWLSYSSCVVIVNVLSRSKSMLHYDRQTVGKFILVSSTHLGPKKEFLLLPDSCGFVDMEHPVCCEDRSVIYNCFWPSPMQSFLGPSPSGAHDHILLSQIRDSPQSGGPDLNNYIPQK